MCDFTATVTSDQGTYELSFLPRLCQKEPKRNILMLNIYMLACLRSFLELGAGVEWGNKLSLKQLPGLQCRASINSGESRIILLGMCSFDFNQAYFLEKYNGARTSQSCFKIIWAEFKCAGTLNQTNLNGKRSRTFCIWGSKYDHLQQHLWIKIVQLP